ncbi:MAG: hypothetical protein LBM97_01675 [Candidatus Nomurabacteria bacterium]|nr:hypothetical protein [Candidatus Nomurabacteria bacterium]
MATINKKQNTRYDLIKQSRRTMIMVVVVVSIIVGFGVVGIRRLVVETIFTGKVIAQKNITVKNIKTSSNNMQPLENKIKVLSLNEALQSARFEEKESTLRVVPDALPSVYNEVSLGSSLSERLLKVDGATVESVRTGNSASTATGGTSGAASAASAVKSANFNFTVSGDETAIKKVLENLEKSVRFITTNQINISYTGRIQLNVRGVAYYVDESQVALTSVTISADNKKGVKK